MRTGRADATPELNNEQQIGEFDSGVCGLGGRMGNFV